MASKSKQLDLGNKVEKEIGKFFKKNGYWCHILQKKVSGQPVDIVAIKDNINWLVDAKHLDKNKKSFDFSRIEPNQIDSLTYAKNHAGIKNLGFVICVGEEEEFSGDTFKGFFLHYDYFIELREQGAKSVKLSVLEDFQEVLNKCELK